MPTPLPPPAGACAERLVGGDFEQATSSTDNPHWRDSGEVPFVRGVPAPQSHSRQNMVILARNAPSEADLWQEVPLPNNPTGAPLTFWHKHWAGSSAT